MIRRVVVCLFFSLGVMAMGGTAWAEPRQYSLGIDLVRMVDEEQYGGMLGLSYQASLGTHSALVGRLARQSRYTIFEGLYKVYGDTYFDGPFAAAGVVTGRYEGDKEIGFLGALGYELSINQFWVISGAVECTWGTMKHPITGHHDPLFRPALSLILAF